MRSVLNALLVVVILGIATIARADGGADWVLVDTQALTLTVFSAKNRVLARFHNIAIGSGGPADMHLQGDETTPRGLFHVAWIDRRSRFNTFYGLNYPNARIARHAVDTGILNQAQFDAIMQAVRHHRIPPQNTPLGGQLGIHGLGRGDLDIQRTINWTNGCVALTNHDIRRLGQWVHVGTRVIIR